LVHSTSGESGWLDAAAGNAECVELNPAELPEADFMPPLLVDLLCNVCVSQCLHQNVSIVNPGKRHCRSLPTMPPSDALPVVASHVLH
jgi:hypothetical protein